MQKEQKQTHHGGTGEQDTELGSAQEKKPGSGTGQGGATHDQAAIRNPSGDDIGDAIDGDEGSGRTV